MDAEIVIIGAGVVGLAIASELSEVKKNVYVLEQHESFGKETSSRNSEVIHAGIYYPGGTLKAGLCVEGANQLYSLCESAKIPYNRIGKLIVAVNSKEKESIESLLQKGNANGCLGLSIIGPNKITELEPNINAVAALYSPNTGIIDSHQLMKYYEQNAISHNASIVYGCRVAGISKISGGYEVSYEDQEGPGSITCEKIVNCAGLFSDIIAAMPGLDIVSCGYKLHYCKGEYFAISPLKSRMVNRLIYPSPMEELTGLGIHATKDLGGRLKLGPNAFYVNTINYDVDSTHANDFYISAKLFLPFLQEDDLVPDQSGIRPKLSGTGEKARDFVIVEESKNGLPGFINLIGIESPGLTASPAIAKKVKQLI